MEMSTINHRHPPITAMAVDWPHHNATLLLARPVVLETKAIGLPHAQVQHRSERRHIARPLRKRRTVANKDRLPIAIIILETMGLLHYDSRIGCHRGRSIPLRQRQIIWNHPEWAVGEDEVRLSWMSMSL